MLGNYGLRKGGHATQNVQQEKRKENEKNILHKITSLTKIIILGNGSKVTQNGHQKEKKKKKSEREEHPTENNIINYLKAFIQVL